MISYIYKSIISTKWKIPLWKVKEFIFLTSQVYLYKIVFQYVEDNYYNA